jgi:hypothetical protein
MDYRIEERTTVDYTISVPEPVSLGARQIIAHCSQLREATEIVKALQQVERANKMQTP